MITENSTKFVCLHSLSSACAFHAVHKPTRIDCSLSIQRFVSQAYRSFDYRRCVSHICRPDRLVRLFVLQFVSYNLFAGCSSHSVLHLKPGSIRDRPSVIEPFRSNCKRSKAFRQRVLSAHRGSSSLCLALSGRVQNKRARERERAREKSFIYHSVESPCEHARTQNHWKSRKIDAHLHLFKKKFRIEIICVFMFCFHLCKDKRCGCEECDSYQQPIPESSFVGSN